MSTRKVIVEVCNAHNLMPKDGQGTASPYVDIDFEGQRHRTKTKLKDLDPNWNEKIEFSVKDPASMAAEMVEINVFNDSNSSSRRSNFLGRLKIGGSSIVREGEEVLRYYPLEKRSLFSRIKGELGLKVYYVDEEPSRPHPAEKPRDEKPEADPSPSQPPSKEEKLPATAPQDQNLAQLEEKLQSPEESNIIGEILNRPAAMDTRASAAIPAFPRVDYALKDLNRSLGAERLNSTYDLVEQMQYLYIRIVKAKDLNRCTDGAYVNVTVGTRNIRTRAIPQNRNPEWDQVFAIDKDKLNSPCLDITVWDEHAGKDDDFVGLVSFDLQEIPKRVPPDSPLAPQWYRLEDIESQASAAASKGDIMLAVWIGTQADEAFPEAWQSDTGGLLIHTRSKVYLAPKLWYLRVNVIEAQELMLSENHGGRYPEISVKGQLGFQVVKTRVSISRSTSPFWNEDLMFVAAEPFEETLALTVEDRVGPQKEESLGHVQIYLNSIERRLDNRQVGSRWFNLESSVKEGDTKKRIYTGKIHLRLCFDGGYHVLDEAAHVTSDLRPTSKQLWRPCTGILEVGILGAKNLVPMKTKEGRGSTDSFCVAKYGQKWIRTRTVVDNCNPKWNEQYTWEVFDPCTVFTLGVFDNCCPDLAQNPSPSAPSRDARMGKVRIRLSTLESDRIYTNSYPLLVLHSNGVKKMGDVELAIRFSCYSLMNILQLYTQPLLPKMHYLHPLGLGQQDLLRQSAMKIVAGRLSRSEPPLKQELVHDMLDTDTNLWSMRRSKANWFRIINVLAGATGILKWINDVCQWKKPIISVLVHILFVILVCFPDLILPTLFLYMFLVGVWHYRFRPRMPLNTSLHTQLSYAEMVTSDELDEEFDTFPSSRSMEMVRMRYDRLRSLAARIQTVLGDMASQGERLQALLSWRDPRATSIFVIFCLVLAVLLYLTSFQLIAILSGLYFFRHPRFRDPLPSAPLNFFRRLPALSDLIL